MLRNGTKSICHKQTENKLNRKIEWGKNLFSLPKCELELGLSALHVKWMLLLHIQTSKELSSVKKALQSNFVDFFSTNTKSNKLMGMYKWHLKAYYFLHNFIQNWNWALSVGKKWNKNFVKHSRFTESKETAVVIV